MRVLAWKEAIEGTELERVPTYREGFKSGWFDASLETVSQTAQTSEWGYYSVGYCHGHRAYSFKYSNPVKTEGGITCLKSLLA